MNVCFRFGVFNISPHTSPRHRASLLDIPVGGGGWRLFSSGFTEGLTGCRDLLSLSVWKRSLLFTFFCLDTNVCIFSPSLFTIVQERQREWPLPRLFGIRVTSLTTRQLVL